MPTTHEIISTVWLCRICGVSEFVEEQKSSAHVTPAPPPAFSKRGSIMVNQSTDDGKYVPTLSGDLCNVCLGLTIAFVNSKKTTDG